MKYIIISIILFMFSVHHCIAGQFVVLPDNQEAFFAENIDAVELWLRIKKPIDTISPTIGHLKSLQLLKLVGIFSYEQMNHTVSIPLELLNLPNLHTLKADDIKLVLPFGTDINQIHSNIEAFHFGRLENGDAPFFSSLPQLQQLYIFVDWYSDIWPEFNASGGIDVENMDLSLFINQLPNLRKLNIISRAPINIDQSICTLDNLEMLELVMPYSQLPECMDRLIHLHRMSAPVCGRESSPEIKSNITILASLPNLESLTLWTSYSLEMPEAASGFNKLRELTLAGFPRPDLFVCRLCPEAYYDRTIVTNLSAVTGYPNLERIIIPEIWPSYRELSEFYSFVNTFIDIIDDAWKEGMVNQLEQIEVTETSVWQRPLSREITGNMVPENWKARE